MPYDYMAFDRNLGYRKNFNHLVSGLFRVLGGRINKKATRITHCIL